MNDPPPLPGPDERWALFLDIDGTLVAIAPTPEAARPESGLLPLLARLHGLSGGALALVSGRGLASIDRLFAPLRLPAAGLHGRERRRADGTLAAAQEPAGLLDEARRRLAAYAAARPGLMLEDKGGSLALHYRLAPRHGAAVRRFVQRLAAAEPRLRLIAGRKVMELQPRGEDKGRAIAAFLAEPPFAGRVPVYAGDDTTDEDGFRAVNERGGVSIKVANGETAQRGASAARCRLGSVPALQDWLAALAQRLAAGAGAGGTATVAGALCVKTQS